MIITSFVAKNVYGYLNFEINFNEDVNFLVGLNGCGKTTALELITAVLEPDLEELVKIPFDYCKVNFEDNRILQASYIEVERADGYISLSTPSKKDVVRASEEAILQGDLENDSVLQSISKLANPMFISLDRKFPKVSGSSQVSAAQSGLLTAQMIWGEKPKQNNADKLEGVKELLKEEFRWIEKRKMVEDERLKDKILLDAFTVIDNSEVSQFGINCDINEIEKNRRIISEALDSLGLRDKHQEKLSKATDKFFDELEKYTKEYVQYKDQEENTKNDRFISAMGFMFVNHPQIMRINNLVNFITESQDIRKKLYERVDNFEKIVNSFFSQTGKKINLSTGSLRIEVAGRGSEVKSLSSGETQIITLFAHIIFNRKFATKASFIIDEPELSLHLDWQDMFVECLGLARPNLQVILATHSPAIINGKDSKCVFVNSDQGKVGLL